MFFTISERAKRLEQRRVRAGRYFNEGKSQAWVAQRLGVTPVAAWKWFHAWEKDPERGLKSKGRCGVKKTLAKEGLRKIQTALDRGALAAGFSNDLWTLERVRAVVKRETHISYHIGHVWKLLTNDLGWSNQKPTRRARERNEAAIVRWRKVQWPAIQKRGRAPMPPSDSLTNLASQIDR